MTYDISVQAANLTRRAGLSWLVERIAAIEFHPLRQFWELDVPAAGLSQLVVVGGGGEELSRQRVAGAQSFTPPGRYRFALVGNTILLPGEAG